MILNLPNGVQIITPQTSLSFAQADTLKVTLKDNHSDNYEAEAVLCSFLGQSFRKTSARAARSARKAPAA